MVDETRKSTQTPEGRKRTAKDNGERLADLAAFNGVAMEMIADGWSAYARGLAALNGEVLGFVNLRLRQDTDLARAMTRCDSWEDALGLQRDWARQATEQYTAEASKLGELASGVAQESWQPFYARQ